MRTLMRQAAVASALASVLALGENRDMAWKTVNDAIRDGLPRTAITALDPIITEARDTKAYAEAVKALGLRIALEGRIEGNKPEEKILRLQAEIEKQPAEMRPTLEAILAHWYWEYFQVNRWRFLQRTATTMAPGTDLVTWDLARILAEVDVHFSRALAGDKALQATPIATWDDLLDKGSMPDAYRPTLFDFLAHEALLFYSAGEQAGAAAEDEFVLAARSPIFAPAGDFLQWQPEGTDETSPTLKAVRLYQKLLAFHRDDADHTAFIDADLGRLVFGHNKAAGQDSNERYKRALDHFVDTWAGHEVSAHALVEWARVLHGEGEFVEALTLAQRGLAAFPASTGGAMCFNLIQAIEAKSASIQTERVWNDPMPSIHVTYRNITQVYFRAVPDDFESRLEKQRWSWHHLDATWRKELLEREPALVWSHELPTTSDYRARTEKLPCPRALKPGFYFILASHDSSFGENDNQLSIASIWVSNLALVIRQDSRTGAVEGFVLQALSGEPLAGATVRSWSRNREGAWRSREQGRTDGDGFFRFIGPADHGLLLLAQYGGHRVAADREIRTHIRRDDALGEQTVFFTDRSLYRPGQTIYYKGIRLRFDHVANDYRALAGDNVSVIFSDANSEEISRATHMCNDYGSFSGAFTAPRDRLMGRMTLSSTNGSASVHVEEYKRPKLRVELAAPKEAAKLDAEVVVPGKATAYTGAAIGGAKVRWRVVREVRFPPWCWWGRFRPMRQTSQSIAHGTVTTADDGSFAIRFIAQPDRNVPEQDEPVFEYHVYADVTDASGETRSDERTVRAGYTALQASLAASEWQTPEQPVDVKVTTSSLDGVPQPARGTLEVYRLLQPARVVRAELEGPYGNWFALRGEPKQDPSDPNTWELGALVGEKPFATDATGATHVLIDLESGIYRAVLETQDGFGKPVGARLLLHVVDPKARRFPIRIANHFTAPTWTVEPGGKLVVLWGTGYESGRACVEIEHRGKLLRRYWTRAGHTQAVIEHQVGEELRGGFIVRVTCVRENRAYLNVHLVDVPWSNKKLTVKWERFRSKLIPGQKETWTAVVSGPNARNAVVEMVAGMYDASLDQYAPHEWPQAFHVFRHETAWRGAWFVNTRLDLQHILGGWVRETRGVDLRYRAFPREIVAAQWNMPMAPAMPAESVSEALALNTGTVVQGGELHVRGGRSGEVSVHETGLTRALSHRGTVPTVMAHPDLDKIGARRNLDETAFFFPHLQSDSSGVVTVQFTMPEALTEWKFLGFAHDRELRSGFLTDRVVTSKDLMVEPNPPRFVREGDAIEFTVKVTNRTADRQAGRVRLTLADARTLELMDTALGNTHTVLEFDVPGNGSRSYSWRLTVPDGCEFLTYKAVGTTATLSDGEEGFLPVLSRRILVTESLPLPIRGKKAQQFEFTSLLASSKSSTLQHQSLTVQMVSQPAWYAVMALPYLMDFPYACSEQEFNRLYANSLARHIAESDPKIRRIFEQWKGTPALDSPLEKNQDLKAVMLEETPWLRQAQAESQARRQVGILFDHNRLSEETSHSLRKLSEMQLAEGLWPWFPGGYPNTYISLYITTGFGRLRALGVDIDVSPAVKSLAALDLWMEARYRDILAHGHPDRNHLDHMIAFYLYGRSFFLSDRPVAGVHQEALAYWRSQARKYWLELKSRQSQGHVAIGLQRFGDEDTPRAILKSLAEYSVHDPELGMFWRDLEASWWWYRAPIETQALMIEAFDEVARDSVAVEECKVWLLKQKQTQDWKTTKATADAVYALLLRGTRMLASDALVEVALAGETTQPRNVEAGTGFYEQRFVRREVRPAMGRITVKKKDEGVSWGSVHWQYLEDMAKVPPYAGTPLTLQKSLFVKETTKKGQILRPVDGALAVGDELVVRIELRTDRDMEYVHLTDQRGSGTEPVNVLSQYKYQDGLAYYENTRDTASHFFIDYLPKGTYVFEYATRIQHKGTYQTGVASIQCMYAPEFNSHSKSFELEVQ